MKVRREGRGVAKLLVRQLKCELTLRERMPETETVCRPLLLDTVSRDL